LTEKVHVLLINYQALELLYHDYLQKLEQKIGEALGLEKAAQIAVEDLSAKGLLDKGGMKDKLQTMKRQANNHQAKLEELIPDLESEGLSSENIENAAGDGAKGY
jgi:hypothetical protein